MSEYSKLVQERGGWGYTNKPDTEFHCCVNRSAGCCALKYWYSPYASATGFTESVFHQDCCGWHTDAGNVDGVSVKYKHEIAFCGDQTVEVLSGDGSPIGRVIRYTYCLPPCEDRVYLEALSNNNESRYTFWERGCCPKSCTCVDLCRPCAYGCKICSCEGCNFECCGWLENDIRVGGPRERGSDYSVTAITWRRHTMTTCYGMWLGYRQWPENTSANDKALLIGMTHAILPMMH